jgi:hypothetical protein
MVFVISTLNIDEVDYSVLSAIVKKFLSECLTNAWLNKNLFIPPIHYLVQQLRSALNEVIKTDKYIM